MTDYTELLNRLRGVNWICHTYGKTEITHDTVCHEAADAIEAQAKRIAELEAALKPIIPDASLDEEEYSMVWNYHLVKARAALEKKND